MAVSTLRLDLPYANNAGAGNLCAMTSKVGNVFIKERRSV